MSVFFWLCVTLAALVGVLAPWVHRRLSPPKRKRRAAWWYKDPVREMFAKVPIPLPSPKRVVPEMMVFNKELSIEEIRHIHEGRSVAEDRLIAAWGQVDRVIGPDEKVTYLGSELTLAQMQMLAGISGRPSPVSGPKIVTE